MSVAQVVALPLGISEQQRGGRGLREALPLLLVQSITKAFDFRQPPRRFALRIFELLPRRLNRRRFHEKSLFLFFQLAPKGRYSSCKPLAFVKSSRALLHYPGFKQRNARKSFRLRVAQLVALPFG
ncbi:MAG: hypothetical protein OXI87_02300, partial [Albidovulum sp.]|nr:hypothetical protein [Albidovulum sp.]